jgi:nucleoside 2-deoxyribosyltransferase
MSNKKNKFKVYLAAGWFNPVQADELTQLENICSKREWIDLASPRRIFVCPPNASKEVQDSTFYGNLHHIQTADFLIVNTRDKDIGTIWEAGYAHANERPIIYFCAGLPEGAKFNLMLARSGVKVCTSFEDLEDYLDRCHQAGSMLLEPYDQDIE